MLTSFNVHGSSCCAHHAFVATKRIIILTLNTCSSPHRYLLTRLKKVSTGSSLAQSYIVILLGMSCHSDTQPFNSILDPFWPLRFLGPLHQQIE